MLRRFSLLAPLLCACASPSPPTETAPTPAVLTTASSVATATRVPEGTDGRVDASVDAGAPEPDEVRGARALLEELKASDTFVDPDKGLIWVEAGPSGAEGSIVREGKRLCGAAARAKAVEAAKELAQQLDREWAEIMGYDKRLVPKCTNLVCEKPAYGEWDNSLTLRFERTAGRLVLVSSETLKDVPMRASATADMAWIAKKRTELAKRTCPRR